MKAITKILSVVAILAVAYAGFAFMDADDAPRKLSGFVEFDYSLAAADSLQIWEFTTKDNKVDATMTFDGSANATFIVQGSNIDDNWVAIDTASYTGTAVTLTLTNLPKYVRVYLESAAANEIEIGGKIYDSLQ